MMRLANLTITVALATGIGAANAQNSGDANSKLQSMTGVVKTCTASSLTIESGGHEIAFALDRSTRLFGRGAGINDLVWRDPPKSRIADVLKSGDQVTVKYRVSDGA